MLYVAEDLIYACSSERSELDAIVLEKLSRGIASFTGHLRS